MADFNNANSNTIYFKPNTNGLVMFNEENNMMLMVSYYDNFMKFELRERNIEGKYPAPEIGKDITVLLSEEKVYCLNMMLEEFEKKLAAYNNDFADGKDCSNYPEYSVGVYTGQTSEKTRVFQISTGKVTDHGFVPIIHIHIGTDANMVALRTYSFKTRFTPGLIDYDWSAGSTKMVTKLAQYEMVSLAVKVFCMAANKAVCHFNKTFINDDRVNKMYRMLTSVMEHFGIPQPENNSQSFGNKYRNNTAFDSFNSNNTPAPPVIEGGDIGTLLGMPNA